MKHITKIYKEELKDSTIVDCNYVKHAGVFITVNYRLGEAFCSRYRAPGGHVLYEVMQDDNRSISVGMPEYIEHIHKHILIHEKYWEKALEKEIAAAQDCHGKDYVNLVCSNCECIKKISDQYTSRREIGVSIADKTVSEEYPELEGWTITKREEYLLCPKCSEDK